MTAEPMKARYAAAKALKNGDLAVCPVCESSFRKASVAQAFCSNNGKANCKDRYWHAVRGSTPRQPTQRSMAQLAADAAVRLAHSAELYVDVVDRYHAALLSGSAEGLPDMAQEVTRLRTSVLTGLEEHRAALQRADGGTNGKA